MTQFLYSSGEAIRLHDRVRIGWTMNFLHGEVVAVIHAGEFAPGYPPDGWDMEQGLLIETKEAGLIGYEEMEGELLSIRKLPDNSVPEPT